jgi:phage baseplate assembly protein V
MSTEPFWQAEFARQQANIVQFGKVVELDAAAARVRVELGGNKTAWIPWLAASAGEDRQWSAPEPGEQVVVLAPNGDMAQGVVLRGVYSTAYGAPATSADKTRFQWKGGAWVELDRQTKALEVNLPAGGPGIRLVCGSSVLEVKDGEVKITADLLTIVAPTTTSTGLIDAQGEVFAGGSNIGLASHKHGGVVSGGAQTSGPVP